MIALSPKEVLRQEIRQKLRLVTQSQRLTYSQSACHHLLKLPEIIQSQKILLFASLPSEIDTTPLFHYLIQQKKQIAFPKIILPTHQMETYLVQSLDDLHMNKWGIREPENSPNTKINPLSFDSIVIPGIAFDRTGRRLGRGKGFYDHFLRESKTKALRIGLFYSCQELPAVLTHDKDEKMNTIVTEQEIIHCNSEGLKS